MNFDQNPQSHNRMLRIFREQSAPIEVKSARIRILYEGMVYEPLQDACTPAEATKRAASLAGFLDRLRDERIADVLEFLTGGDIPQRDAIVVQAVAGPSNTDGDMLDGGVILYSDEEIENEAA